VRGKLGPILSGVGGFLVVLGVMMNVYVYPKVAVAPLDQEAKSTLIGKNATVFDIGSLSEINTDVTVTANVLGDVAAAEKEGGGVAVWKNATSTYSADGVMRSASIEQVPFDQHTGAAVDCCDAYSEQEQGNAQAVKFEGQIFKFPFRTEKKDYGWWDSTLKKTFPAKFVEEDEVKGVKTYVFRQVIEPTVWTTMEVPASVVGEVGKGNLIADRTYANTRTFWVEPATGVVMDRTEEQRATLQFEGEDRVTLTNADVRFSDETVQANVDEYGGKPTMLMLVRIVLPLVLGIGGVLLIVAGVLIGRRNAARAQQG
jgi:hypothetical protein